MRAVILKLMRDLRSNQFQRLGIFLMLFLATTALTTSLMVQARGGTAWEDLYAESNGAHLWFYGPAEELPVIAARAEVRDSGGPFPVARLTVPAVRTPNGGGYPLWLEGIPGPAPDTYAPIVTSGRWYESPGEIVLPRTFANDFGYEAGDRIVVRAPDGTESELTVVGLAVFAGRSPFSLPVLGWAAPETVEATGAPDTQFAALAVRIENRAQTAAFRDALERDLGGSEFFLIEDWNDVRAQNDESTAILVLFLGVFSTFALISAGFVIVNAIGGRVLARYRDIGLLKAIGFTPRQIAGGLLLEQCGLALVAAVGGVALGSALVPLLDEPVSKEFQTSTFGFFEPWLAIAITVGVVLLVAVATAIPAWRAGRVPVVRAITTGFGRTSARASRIGDLAERTPLPAWAVLGVRDAFERPLRAWLTVGALVFAVVTITFVSTSEWTLRRFAEDASLTGEPFELAVDGSPEGIETYLRAQPEVEAIFTRDTLSVTPEGKDKQVNLVALGSGYEEVDWVVTRGRLFEAPGEAIVGEGFFQLMDANIGDTVTLEVLGKPLTFTIVGQFRATEDGGRWAMTSIETAREQIDPNLDAGDWAIKLSDPAQTGAFVQRVRTQFPGMGGIEIWDHSIDGAAQVRGVLMGLAVLLLLVGLVSLINTIATGINERRRDLGILKVLGLTPRQVAASVVTNAAILSVAAVIVGIPLGLWVSYRISDVMGSNLGWGPGLLETPPWYWFAMIGPVVILIAMAAALLPANAAARTNTSTVLRSE